MKILSKYKTYLRREFSCKLIKTFASWGTKSNFCFTFVRQKFILPIFSFQTNTVKKIKLKNKSTGSSNVNTKGLKSMGLIRETIPKANKILKILLPIMSLC